MKRVKKNKKKKKSNFVSRKITNSLIQSFKLCNNVKDCKESKVLSVRNDMLISLKGTLRACFGSGQYKFQLSGYTGVQTNGAGVLIFNDISGTPQYISCALSNSILAEWGSIAILFDDFKVTGMDYHYEPYNPYNRGTSVNSDMIGIGFDDNANIAPTTSNSGFSSQCERGKWFNSFSPDHTSIYRFKRPRPLSQYDWTPTLSPGSQTSSLGSMFVASIGTLNISTRYGAIRFVVHLQCAMRY